MRHTRQWLITRLVPAAPLTAGQPLAAVAGHCAQRLLHEARPMPAAAKAAGPHLVSHGLALTLQNDGVLAIVCETPCALHVLSGQAWVTAEGKSRDIVVEPRSSFPLARGARFSVSPLHDTLTFVVGSAGASSVQFTMSEADGPRTLTIAPAASGWQRALGVLRERLAAIESALPFPRTIRSQS